jgi:hypothetical protein
METAPTRIRVLAQRDSADTCVALVWLEGTQRVWIEVREAGDAVAVEPERALGAFHHPYAYLSRAAQAPHLLAA